MFGRPSVDDYEREQAARLETERRAETARAAARAAREQREAEQRAERERQAQERAKVLLDMDACEHLERAAERYARGGDANGIVVELLFAIAKGAGRHG